METWVISTVIGAGTLLLSVVSSVVIVSVGFGKVIQKVDSHISNEDIHTGYRDSQENFIPRREFDEWQSKHDLQIENIQKEMQDLNQSYNSIVEALENRFDEPMRKRETK